MTHQDICDRIVVLAQEKVNREEVINDWYIGQIKKLRKECGKIGHIYGLESAWHAYVGMSTYRGREGLFDKNDVDRNADRCKICSEKRWIHINQDLKKVRGRRVRSAE